MSCCKMLGDRSCGNTSVYRLIQKRIDTPCPWERAGEPVRSTALKGETSGSEQGKTPSRSRDCSKSLQSNSEFGVSAWLSDKPTPSISGTQIDGEKSCRCSIKSVSSGLSMCVGVPSGIGGLASWVFSFAGKKWAILLLLNSGSISGS